MRLMVMAFLIAAVPALAADGVRVVENVDYVSDADYANDKDKLDLYLPEGRTGFPVVVFFHGGGLRNGDKDASSHVGQAFAASGIGAAIVNYRLSPDVSHPAHAQDAARSVAWVHANISEHGGDPEKVFLAGHSAGAYLAVLLVLDDRYLGEHTLQPTSLAGSMPISGFFYVDEVAPDRPKEVWGEEPAGWLDASPAEYLRTDAPPLLLVYADGDDAWRREQNERLADALRAKGHADVAAVQISNRDHQGIWKSLAVDDVTLDQMVAFVESH